MKKLSKIAVQILKHMQKFLNGCQFGAYIDIDIDID